MNTKSINRMRNLKLVLFAAILASCGGWAQSAFAQVETAAEKGGAHCFCKASCVDLTGQVTAPASVVCKDYGTQPGVTYSFPVTQKDRVKCASWCNNVSTPDVHSQVVANQCCNIHCSNGSVVRAYSAIGTGKYAANETEGTLTNIPPVTHIVVDKPGICKF